MTKTIYTSSRIECYHPKVVKSAKQAQYREKCQEKKEMLREKKEDAKMERERVGKKRRLMKGNAGVVYH